MSEPSAPSAWQKFIKFSSDSGGLVTFGGIVITIILWALRQPDFIVGLFAGVVLFSLIIAISARVYLGGDDPVMSIRGWRQDSQKLKLREPDQELPVQEHVRSVSVSTMRTDDKRPLSLEQIEQHYELKKLEPNLQSTTVDPEAVAAHYDEQGIIVIQPKPDADVGFRAYVVPITNGNKARVGEARKVRARITFRDFQQSHSGTVHRGAWLSEKETEIDFPPNCSPRRLILITVEGAAPRLQVFSISRDFDSSYKGTFTMREELHGELYEFKVALFDERHAAKPLKTFAYILEVGHLVEGAFAVTLSNAYFWKSKHLSEFVKEGLAFSLKLHEIWKYANDQIPIAEAPPSHSNMLSGSRTATEKIDYPNYLAQLQSIEREREDKLLAAIKEWEGAAADFVGLHIGAELSDKFRKSEPSIDNGFNRTKKSAFYLIHQSGPNVPPMARYWTLSDAVSSRTDMLMKIIDELQ